MADGSKTHAQLLVEQSTGRDLDELLTELYVTDRHSQQEIADALASKGAPVSRAIVSQWLRERGITRGARAAVTL
jgi:arginine repressor